MGIGNIRHKIMSLGSTVMGCEYRRMARGAIISKHGFALDVRQREIQRIHYETHLASVLKTKDIDLVIDVGANTGQFARSLRSLGYERKIVSFEPIPDLSESLANESAGDSDWTVMNLALGNESGTLTLNTKHGSTLSSGLKFSELGTKLFPQTEFKFEPVGVPMFRLAQVINDHRHNFSGKNWFLKTDTQGYDLDVLKGGDLDSHPVSLVQCELSVMPIYENSPGYVNVIDWLHGQGFVPLGFWPTFYHGDDLRIVEMDCLMAK